MGLTESNILIRPVVNVGISYVFNTAANSWVGGSDLWSNMPTLSKTPTVKIISSEPVITLKFKFLNQLTGVSYESNEIKIWNYSLYKNYVLKMIK